MNVCTNCGKRFATERGFNIERRRCKNIAACVDRALGPSPAKSEAKRLHREQTA